MPIIGEAHIDIRALDRYFRRDVERAVSGLKNVSIDLRVDADISHAQKQIDAFRKNIDKNPIELNIQANTDSLSNSIDNVLENVRTTVDIEANTAPAMAAINDFADTIRNNTVKVLVEADTDLLEIGVDDATDRLQNRTIKVGVDIDDASINGSLANLNQLSNLQNVDLKVTADTSAAETTLQNFLNIWATTPIPLKMIADLTEAENQLDAFKKKQQTSGIPVKANAQTAGAEAQLAALTRSRKVDVVARIEKTSTTVLKGFAEALSGVVPPAQIANALEGVIGNFSTLAVRAGIATAAVGSLGAVLGSGLASVVTIGEDIGDLVGLAALAPAAFLGMQMGMKAATYSFEGFGAAVQGDEKALAKLVPAARRAAESMIFVVKYMKQDTQNSFWNQASDSLIEFADKVMPRYSEQVSGVARSMGVAFSDMLGAIVKNSNTVDGTMQNINYAFQNAAKAAAPLTTALITLGRVGAPYLVDLGRAAANGARDFEKFILSAAKTGDIDRWIQDGIRSMQNLGSIIKSTVTIFGNLASAAEAAGFGGLQSLADGFDRIEEASGRAKTLQALEDIFRGAGEGAEALFDGLGLVASSVLDASEGLGSFLKISGEIGQLAFENLDIFLNADGFGSGILKAMDGMKSGLASIKPGIQDLGEVFGDLAEMAGGLFTAMAPGFNNVMSIISKSIAGIKDGFLAALPVINEFIDMLTTIGGWVPIGIITIVGELLELFAQLPTPIQQATLAIVGLNLAMKSLGLSSVGILGIGTALATLGGRAKAAGGIMGALGSVLGLLGGRGGAAAKGVGAVGGAAAKAATQTAAARASTSLLTSAVAGAAVSAGAAGKQFGILGSTAGSFAGGAAKSTSALSMLGTVGLAAAKKAGLIGVAVTIAAGAFDAYQDSAGASGERTLELASALDQYGTSSGNAADATTNILSNTKTFGVAIGDNIKSLGGLRDVSNTASDGFNKLGWSVDDMASAMNSSGGQWTDYRQNLEDLYSETGRFGSVSEETSRAILGTADAAGMTGVQLNEMINAYDTGNRAVEEHAEAQRKAAEAAREAAELQSAVVGAVRPLGAVASAAADGFNVLGDASASVDEHLRAFRSTLDWATGGLMSETDAKMRSAQASADLSSSLDEIVSSTNAAGVAVLTSKGNFDTGSQAGRDFYASMKDVAAGVHEVGIEAYNTTLKNTGSVKEASRAATEATKPMVADVVASLKEMGITGPAEINKILDVLGLLDEDIAMALNVEGDAAQDLMATKLVADSLVAGNYDMAVGAINEEAMSTIAESVGAGEDYANGNYDAVFKALAKDMGAVEAVEFMQKAAGMEPEAMLKLYAENYASDEAQKVLQDGNLINETKVDLTLDAVDNISPVSQEAISKLREVEGMSPEARLTAVDNLSETARTALAEVLNLDKTDSESILRAIDEASPGVRQALGVVNDFDLSDPQINLSAVDDASPKIVGAIDQALDFDGKQVTTTLDALDNLSPKARTALANVLGIEDSSGTALLDAVNNLSPQAAQAVADLAGVESVDSVAVLEAIDNISPKTEYAITSIGGLDGKTAEAKLEALDNASPKTREALAEVLGINSAEGHALLSAYDNLTPYTRTALDEVMKVDQSEALANLRATDGVTPEAQTAGFSIDTLMQKPSDKDITANNKTGEGVTAAQITMGTLQSVTRSLFGRNMTAEETTKAQATLDTLKAVTRSLFGRNEAGPGRNQAQNTLETLKTVTRSLFGRNEAGSGRNQAQNTLETLKTVTRSLFGRNEAGAGKNDAQRTIDNLKGKTVELFAKNMAGEGVRLAQQTIDNLKGKTVEVITNFISRGKSENAHGGLYMGNGTRVFADGGFAGTIQKFANGGFSGENITRFASGSERHVAQIARGAWPVRQWAEPETGGEAYIPLALAKRARSLEILEIVAKQFGYDLVKQFRNGGIMKSVTPRKPQSFADGGFSGKSLSSYVSGRNEGGSRSTVTSSVSDTANRPVIQMNVHPSAPLNEVQVGEYAANQLYWKLMHS